ncbi:MAG: AAA family ATPase, partial [Candidatus Omnitrophica bacterium]|nr:AAA family ATPase [Candidatus Omnitrophota bacterium]
QGAEPGAKPGDVNAELANMQSMINEMDETLGKISGAADGIGKGAQDVEKRMPGTGGALNGGANGLVDEIQNKAVELQDKAAGLSNKGDRLEQGANAMKDQAFNGEKDLPHPGMGQGVKKEASEFGNDAGDVNKKIKEMRERVNRLKRLADRLKKIHDGSKDPGNMGQVADAIKEEAGKIKADSQSIGKGLGKAGSALEKLGREIDTLAKQIEELGKGEGKDAGQEPGKGDSSEFRVQSSESPEPGTKPGSEHGNGVPQTMNHEPSTSHEPQATSHDLELRGEDKDLTALRNIVKAAEAEKPVEDLQDETGEMEFNTKIDPEAERALALQELMSECERTGLNSQELKEYKEWVDMLKPELIDDMTELVRFLIWPSEESEKYPKVYSGRLVKVVKALLGRAGRVRVHDTQPTPVKLTFLFDKSGSMNEGNRILYSKLTLLLLLEVIFSVNSDIAKKRWPPIEFEIGFFDTNQEPFISHETSAKTGEDRKERLIYDAIKALVAGGGTDDAEAVKTFTTRLKESPKPVRAENDAKRILFMVGDGNVDESDKTAIRKTLAYAKENKINVFGVSVGDKVAMQTVLNAYGADRAVLPKKSDLSDLPELVIQKFAECLKPPSMDIPWEAILRRLSAVALSGSIYSFIIEKATQLGRSLYFSAAVKIKPEERKLISTRYRHFFYEVKENVGNGHAKEYLVFRKADKDGVMRELKWQVAPGGPMVPDTVTVDDDYNENIIREILQTLYLQNVEYTSYSADGRYYIRMQDKKTLALMERGADGEWVTRNEFPVTNIAPQGKETGGKKVFETNGVKWYFDAMRNLYINTHADNWALILPQGGSFSDILNISYDAKTKGYIIFDSDQRRVVMASKKDLTGGIEASSLDLKIEKFVKNEDWEGRILRMSGETGLGKDHLIRAAAHLLKQEVVFVAGNKDMEPEDLTEYPSVGIEENATTGHLYSAVNKGLHNGWWVVIDEINKVPSKVLMTLKTSSVAKTHIRHVNVNGREEEYAVPNHERARIIGTCNPMRDNIEQSAPPDEATQDRFADVKVHWRDPNSEKSLQAGLALKKLDKLRDETGMSAKEYERRKKIIREAADVLVDISFPMRLTFMGYSAKQQTKLREDNFKNWYKLLKDDEFKPNSKSGRNIQRAPSPRVIENIISHAIMFPDTWEHAPLTICQLWFNFHVDDVKPLERKRKEAALAEQFMKPPIRGGKNGIKNEDTLKPIKLTADSFNLDGEYLMVTPETQGEPGAKAYWDPIKIWIHPDARENYLKYGLPEDIAYWLSIDNEYNHRQLYYALQVRALGKSLIFVGDQGTGKSFLAQAIAELLDGPNVPQVEVKPDTDKEELTFKPYVKKGVSGFDFGPVAVGVRDKKTVVLEETTQGKP